MPTDPLVYRLHEITQVYGTSIKAVIHEKFGDGIMSAIDFEIDIQRVGYFNGVAIVEQDPGYERAGFFGIMTFPTTPDDERRFHIMFPFAVDMPFEPIG